MYLQFFQLLISKLIFRFMNTTWIKLEIITIGQIYVSMYIDWNVSAFFGRKFCDLNFRWEYITELLARFKHIKQKVRNRVLYKRTNLTSSMRRSNPFQDLKASSSGRDAFLAGFRSDILRAWRGHLWECGMCWYLEISLKYQNTPTGKMWFRCTIFGR